MSILEVIPSSDAQAYRSFGGNLSHLLQIVSRQYRVVGE